MTGQALAVQPQLGGPDRLYLTSLPGQLLVLFDGLAHVREAFVDMEVIRVAPFAVAGLEILFIRLDGGGKDENGRIDFFHLFIHDPVSGHVGTDACSFSMRLVAKADGQGTIFAVLFDPGPYSLTKGC